ncbi:MAG: hypothetical protein ED859_09960 [Desulfuromonadales bacterium]|nr:MAG: hypothetical protein ED859_09960 [Desulfuromonadales bacterium]
MECASLKKFIAADSQLAQLHHLVRTKARRGETFAIAYNAERFFDLHEKNTLNSLVAFRSDYLENAISRGLMRLGGLILAGGFVFLGKPLLSLCAIPVGIFLLHGEYRLILRAHSHDRSLKSYIRTLHESRLRRRTEFVRDMVENFSVIAECPRS